MIHCYDDGLSSSAPRITEAFAVGCGGKVTKSQQYLGGDSFLWGSPHTWSSVIKPAMKSGSRWFYSDHLYFGKRFNIFRITKNAMQHSGKGRSNGKRLKKFNLNFHNWKKGKHIVVCPPDTIFSRLMGFNAEEWVNTTKLILEKNTDRKIIWRDRLNITKPLEHDLQDAHALITYTSNSAVEALLHGVPVFCNGRCAGQSMGQIDFSKIETPKYPNDRRRWAGVLADNQWTLEEIKNGLAWKKLNKG